MLPGFTPADASSPIVRLHHAADAVVEGRSYDDPAWDVRDELLKIAEYLADKWAPVRMGHEGSEPTGMQR